MDLYNEQIYCNVDGRCQRSNYAFKSYIDTTIPAAIHRLTIILLPWTRTASGERACRSYEQINKNTKQLSTWR